MSKIDKLIITIKKLQCAPAENLETILECIKMDKRITFFSWKMFNIANPTFDIAEADQFIDKEKVFIKILVKLKIKFTYIKLIPDELPRIFYNRVLSSQARMFSNQVKKYFRKIYSGTKVIRITQILDQNPSLKKTYNLVFRQSLKSVINPEKFQKEAMVRQDRKIALKAFGLFAAETAIIFKYFKNPVLLAGIRSVDTYKYEFFKYPKNRPVLPKLFVI